MKYNNYFKLIVSVSLINFFTVSCGKINNLDPKNQNSDQLNSSQKSEGAYNGIWREVNNSGEMLATVLEINSAAMLYCTSPELEGKKKNEDDKNNPIKLMISKINEKSFYAITNENNIFATYILTEKEPTNSKELIMSSSGQNIIGRTFILKDEDAEKEFLKNCNIDEEKPNSGIQPGEKPNSGIQPEEKPGEKPNSGTQPEQKPEEKPGSETKPNIEVEDFGVVDRIIDIVHKTDAKVKGADNLGDKILYGIQAAGEVIVEVTKVLFKWFPKIFR